EELDKFTAKVEDLWTWPTQALINLHNMGFEIVEMDDFSIDEFIKDGGDYMIRRYGKEVGEAQIIHSDIDQERNIFANYIQLNLHQEILPTIDDIRKLIDQDYLVLCNVNSKTLNNESGYTGHFVVIFDYTSTHLILHDPGLPPSENRQVIFADFHRAWEYPDSRSKNLLAFRYYKV
ncbi:MAG: hypothetical protein AAB874_08085, partial [Patescibacteria group bacterium]